MFSTEMLARFVPKCNTEYHFMGGSIRRTSISLPEELLKAGRRLARKRRRNFSNYVADLIAADAEKSASGGCSSPEGEG